jgi:hypothetical protein
MASACVKACRSKCKADHPWGVKRARCKNGCKAQCFEEVAQLEQDVANAEIQSQLDQLAADQRLKEVIVGLIKWVLIVGVIALIIYVFLKKRKDLGLDKVGSGAKEIIKDIVS